MKLSGPQIASLWIQYGGDPATAPMAVAIALAESDGNPQAFNPNDPNGGSVGLFQINRVHGALASYDVPTNVRAAIQLSSNGQDWRQWGAYVDGRYRAYLTLPATPAAPAPAVPVDVFAFTAGDVLAPASATADAGMDTGTLGLLAVGGAALLLWATM